jgi:heme/copper-type cytochrome/quinol oxidase subunit 2
MKRRDLGRWRWAALGAVAVAWFTQPALTRGQAAQQPEPVRTFEITASKYMFEPSTIEVKRGDHVKLILRSRDTTHGLALKEFKVNVEIPKGGAPVTAEFVADQAGTFQFKCSHFCGLGHRGMKGQLVVTAAGQ